MIRSSLSLHIREFGEPGRPPLLLLHGLFGASANWQTAARGLQEDFRLIVPDLRNHGRSPHHPVMDYPAMAGDVLALMDSLGIESTFLLGHSMGGKVAMWLALNQPERVDRLVVADIAPVRYPSRRFEAIFQGLRELPLEALESREEADLRLSSRVPQRGVRQYLLQNLVRDAGGWRWRFALPVLLESMERLEGFPASDGLSFAGSSLFLYGERSDYVTPAYHGDIQRLFPHARIRRIAAAGHWLYAEQPDAFVATVKAFLG